MPHNLYVNSRLVQRFDFGRMVDSSFTISVIGKIRLTKHVSLCQCIFMIRNTTKTCC